MKNYKRGAEQKGAKLSEADIRGIRNGFQMGFTKSDLAKIYCVSWVTIHNVVTGKKWKHVG